jgi:hypothetical protein
MRSVCCPIQVSQHISFPDYRKTSHRGMLASCSTFGEGHHKQLPVHCCLQFPLVTKLRTMATKSTYSEVKPALARQVQSFLEPRTNGYFNTTLENKTMERRAHKMSDTIHEHILKPIEADIKHDYNPVILMSRNVPLLVHKIIDSKPRRKTPASYTEYSPSIFPPNG